MDKKTSNLLFTFLYLLAFYLAIKFIPFEKLDFTSWLPMLLQVISLLLLLAWIIHETRKNGLSDRRNENHISYLLCIPYLLGCSSNLLYCLFFQKEVIIDFDALSFVLKTFDTLFGVAIEELLFRFFLVEFLLSLLKDGKWKNMLVILYSSLFFSLMHVINFYGNAPLNVLIQMGYTFALGLILGTVALLYETPVLVVIGHFLFNYLNMDVYSCFYDVEINVSYVLFSVGIVIILLVYLVLLYDLDRRKKKRVSDQ